MKTPSNSNSTRALSGAITASLWLLVMLALKIALNRYLPRPLQADYPDALRDEQGERR